MKCCFNAHFELHIISERYSVTFAMVRLSDLVLNSTMTTALPENLELPCCPVHAMPDSSFARPAGTQCRPMSDDSSPKIDLRDPKSLEQYFDSLSDVVVWGLDGSSVCCVPQYDDRCDFPNVD